MLDAIRKRTGSVVVKVLLGLLVLSFGVWGVGDMVRTAASSQNALIKVGDTSISSAEITGDVQREMNRIRAALGDSITLQQAKSMGLLDSVIQGLATRTLLLKQADNLDVLISDDLVLEEIKNLPPFQEAGRFDKAKFQQILFTNRISEGQFIEMVRDDLARAQVLEAVRVAKSPTTLADTLYRHRNEKRDVAVVTLASKDFENVPAPEEADLKAWLEENQDRYMINELRNFTILEMRPRDLVDTIEISEEDIKAAFDERHAEFVSEETRQVRQMIFDSEEKAKAAYDKVKGGADFAAVALELLDAKADGLSLGYMAKGDLPEILSTPVFAAAVGDVVEPQKSPFGWHLLQVTDIKGRVEKTLAEVHDDLAKALKLEQASNKIYDLSNVVQDAIGGGATLEEAAKANGFSLKSFTEIDLEGNDRAGLPKAGLFTRRQALKVAFETDAGTESGVTDDGENGMFIVRVDSVTPPQPRTLDEVRAQISEEILKKRRASAAEDAATALQKAAAESGSLAKAAEEKGYKVEEKSEILRTNSGLSDVLSKAIFDAKVGAAVIGKVANGFAVAEVQKIHPLEGAVEADKLAQVSQAIEPQLFGEIQAQLAEALRLKYGVKVDYAEIERLINGAQQ